MRPGGVAVIRRFVLRLGSGESGLTLTELAIAMMITSLLSAVMIVWVFAGFGSDATHSSYDAALNDLRTTTDRLSREVRTSNGITAAGVASLTYWLDIDRDGATDSGETITWAITDGGTVVRSTDADVEEIVATHISSAKSTFSYDSETPSEVSRVTIDLIGLAETRAGRDEVHHSFDVYLRNA
jgi:hypothetical protein